MPMQSEIVEAVENAQERAEQAEHAKCPAHDLFAGLFGMHGIWLRGIYRRQGIVLLMLCVLLVLIFFDVDKRAVMEWVFEHVPLLARN